MNNMSEYVVFAQRIGLVGVVQIIASLKGLIILPILTKVLGASDYGIWVFILVTVGLLQPIIKLGLDSAMVRFLSSREKKEIVQGIITVLSAILLTSIIAALVLFLLSDFLASILDSEESVATMIGVASALLILETLNTTVLSSFRIFGQIKRYSAILLLETVLEVGLIAFFVLSGYGLLSAIVSLLISRGITLVIMLYLTFSYAGFAFPNFRLLSPYIAYSLPLVPAFLFSTMVDASDRYVIGFYMEVASVGIYSAAYNLGAILRMIPEYVAYILTPTIINIFDRAKVDATKMYLSYSYKYLMMFLIPSAFGLSILAEPLLGLLTTAEFISMGRFIVPLVTLSMVLFGIGRIFHLVVLLSKRTRIIAIAFGIAAALNLGLNILLVPHWGIIAAAITTVMAYAIILIIFYLRSTKYLRFDTKPGFIIKSIASSIVMASLIWLVNPFGIVSIVLSVAVGAIIYFTLLYLLRGLSRNEMQFFFELFKNTVRKIRLGDKS